MYLGKKIYHSRALGSVRLIVVLMSAILLLNLYFQTLQNPHFLDLGYRKIQDIFRYHWIYPQEIILYIVTVLIPSAYYGFIRGVRFFEKGLIFNRGLPFFNTTLLYKDIENYEVVNPKYLISIREKITEDQHMFGLGKVDRAVAIFDQSGIKGDFGTGHAADYMAKKKLILFFFIFGVLAALIQYFGWVRFFFNLL